MPQNSVLIGLGQIGLRYDLVSNHIDLHCDHVRTHAKSLYLNPNFNLIAGIDPSHKNRALFSTTYKLPSFFSLEEASNNFEFNQLDLVTIAVPPSLQYSVLSDLFEVSSPKVILLEKPICGLEDDINQIAEFTYANSVYTTFLVNYQRNYLPETQDLICLIKSGEFGRLIHGSLFYGKGLMMNGSHYLSLLRSFLGEVSELQVMRSSPCIYPFDREVDFTIRYTEHENACLNVISVGNYFRRMGEIDLIFENARVKWSDGDKNIEIKYLKDANDVRDTHLPYIGPCHTFNLNPASFIPSVYNRISSFFSPSFSKLNHTNTCSFHHGLETFKLVKSILEQT